MGVKLVEVEELIERGHLHMLAFTSVGVAGLVAGGYLHEAQAALVNEVVERAIEEARRMRSYDRADEEKQRKRRAKRRKAKR